MTKAVIRHMAREWAMQYLYQEEVVQENNKENIELFWQQLTNHPSAHKKGFVQGKIWAEEFINGVLKNLDNIDDQIEEKTQNWTFDRISLVDLTIIRLAVYELIYDDTPRPIVISEALKLAKGFGEKKSSSFINGIVDQI